jgi:hypothetical protein
VVARAFYPGSLVGPSGPGYRGWMLKAGDNAPDLAVGATRLHRILDERAVVLFFFPKAFTPG